MASKKHKLSAKKKEHIKNHLLKYSIFVVAVLAFVLFVSKPFDSGEVADDSNLSTFDEDLSDPGSDEPNNDISDTDDDFAPSPQYLTETGIFEECHKRERTYLATMIYYDSGVLNVNITSTLSDKESILPYLYRFSNCTSNFDYPEGHNPDIMIRFSDTEGNGLAEEYLSYEKKMDFITGQLSYESWIKSFD
ncbi:MAG: hypothetical protein ACLFPQ_04675 [Candidatus Woesearchaeota archaeon]